MTADANKVEYEFFSEEANFITMLDVSSKVKKIRDRVIKEFWNELEEEMTKTFPKWVVEFSDHKSDHPKKMLRMYKSEWAIPESNPKLAIGIQGLNFGDKPFIGVCKHAALSNDIFVGNPITDNAVQKLENYGEKRSGDWWFSIKWMGYELSTDSNLVSILPKNRPQIISGIIEDCQELVSILDS